MYHNTGYLFLDEINSQTTHVIGVHVCSRQSQAACRAHDQQQQCLILKNPLET